MKLKNKIIIAIILIIVIVSISYIVITRPREYEIENLSFKLPYDFEIIPLYINRYGIRKNDESYCYIEFSISNKSQKEYEERIEHLTDFYDGIRKNKTINNIEWLNISEEYSEIGNSIMQFYVAYVDSKYYEVRINSSFIPPFNDKDINMIINSLRIINK